MARQTDALLTLLDELHARATFFVLGMAARAHPELLERIVAAGHEIGCHGDAHLPVHTQTPEEFATDLRAARATITQLTGHTPVGYRAPAFSITKDSDWASRCWPTKGSRMTRASTTRRRLRDRTVTTAGPSATRARRGGRQLWEFPLRSGAAGRRDPNPRRWRVVLASAPDARDSQGPDRGRPARPALSAPERVRPRAVARAPPEHRDSQATSPRHAPRGPAQRRPAPSPGRPQSDCSEVRADPLW